MAAEMRAEEAAAMLGVMPATLANWRSHGYGPPFYKRGRIVYYKRSHVQAWIGHKVCHACGQKLTHKTRAARG